ncbi:nitroreductase [bacterium]|nr:nitroreductase [bacterium]
MDAMEVLLTRRTIYKFKTDDVPDEAIREAINAATHAPNHKLTRPWRFVRVGRETRKALLEIATDLKKPTTDAGHEAVRMKTLDPPVLIVVTRVLTDDAFRAREDYAACACATQNLMLALHARGIGSHWGTGGLTRDPRSYELFGIDKGKEEITAFVWVGYAETTPSPERPPWEEFYRELP